MWQIKSFVQIEILDTLDGNKRVAFATTAIFLSMNGYRLKVEPDDGESFLIDEVIQKRIPLEDIATWLETHMKRKG